MATFQVFKGGEKIRAKMQKWGSRYFSTLIRFLAPNPALCMCHDVYNKSGTILSSFENFSIFMSPLIIVQSFSNTIIKLLFKNENLLISMTKAYIFPCVLDPGLALHESPDLKRLSRLHEILEVLFLDPDLSSVHELQNGTKVSGGNVAKDDDWVLTGVALI